MRRAGGSPGVMSGCADQGLGARFCFTCSKGLYFTLPSTPAELSTMALDEVQDHAIEFRRLLPEGRMA